MHKIFLASSCKVLGQWYEAEPLFPGKGKKLKYVDLKDFDVIYDDSFLENCEKLKNKIKNKKQELLRLGKEIRQLEKELSAMENENKHCS